MGLYSMSMIKHPVIKVEGLRKTYGVDSVAVHAIESIDFCVNEGEFVSIMGPSGSGKSTFLHVLACLQRATGGTYALSGERIESFNDDELSDLRNRKIGIVFQKFNLLPHETIVENVALPLVYAGVPSAIRNARAKEVLISLGLGDRLKHRPTELSGGQDQRVAIARALVSNPDIIFADEPTGNLDSDTGLEVMGIFQALHKMGRTIVQVTHDLEKAQYGERIVRLRDGKIEKDERVASPLVAPVVELSSWTQGGNS